MLVGLGEESLSLAFNAWKVVVTLIPSASEFRSQGPDVVTILSPGPQASLSELNILYKN